MGWPDGSIGQYITLTGPMAQWAQHAARQGANPQVAQQAAMQLYRSAQPMAATIVQNIRYPAMMYTFAAASAEATGLSVATIMSSLMASLMRPEVLIALVLILLVCILVYMGQREMRMKDEMGKRQKMSSRDIVESPPYAAFLTNPLYGPIPCFQSKKLPAGIEISVS